MKEALVPSAHAAAPQLTWTVAEASCWSDPINSSAVGLDLKKGAGNQGRWWASLSLRPSLSLALSVLLSRCWRLETTDPWVPRSLYPHWWLLLDQDSICRVCGLFGQLVGRLPVCGFVG